MPGRLHGAGGHLSSHAGQPGDGVFIGARKRPPCPDRTSPARGHADPAPSRLAQSVQRPDRGARGIGGHPCLSPTPRCHRLPNNWHGLLGLAAMHRVKTKAAKCQPCSALTLKRICMRSAFDPFAFNACVAPKHAGQPGPKKWPASPANWPPWCRRASLC